MAYIVADTYKDWEQIGEQFKDNGRTYIRVKGKCDRPGCYHGIYATGVCNGSPVPHPAYGGICLKCGGTGFIEKTVRTYTESQKAALDRAKANRAKTAEKRAEERAKEMERKAANFRAEAMAKKGFDEQGNGYLIYGKTFDYKDYLKENGCKFNGGGIKGWVHPTGDFELPTGCVTVKIEFDLCYVMNGKVTSLLGMEGVKEYVSSCADAQGAIKGSTVGEVGERLRKMEVELIHHTGFEGYYGYTNIYVFEDADKNRFKWFTTKELEERDNWKFILSGTIKGYDDFDGYKTTVLTRCIVA